MLINFKKLRDREAIVLSAVAFALLVFALAFYFIYIPLYVGNAPIKITIEKGQNLGIIAKTLEEKGLLKDDLSFKIYVKFIGKENSIKSGSYNFSGRLDVPDIVFILVNGLSESEDIRLLISEGFNVWEIDRRLANLDLIKEGIFSAEFYDEEGYLFPDTYRINRKAEGPNFIQELRERMDDNFKKRTAELLAGLSLAETREIVTIASILEKEVRRKEDMELVSGIIRKRLELGMPLQIDATVIYGACLRKFGEQLNSAGAKSPVSNCSVNLQGPALEIPKDGSYNTYTRKGLPPGPISNPGLESISAALNPKDSPYLYYLSTRDTGQIIYSKTAGEHVANRRKYLGI